MPIATSTQTTFVGCAAFAFLTDFAVNDPTTAGPPTDLFLVAIFVVPFVASFINAVFANEPPIYTRASLLPAALFYFSILAVSIANSGSGLNFLVFAIIELIGSGAIGYFAGKTLYLRVIAK